MSRCLTPLQLTGARHLKIERMARGFDSKFVEAQQDEATRDKKLNPAMTAEQREVSSKRAALELSRARAAADLLRATAPAHRRMLEHAIAALDAQLAELPTT